MGLPPMCRRRTHSPASTAPRSRPGSPWRRPVPARRSIAACRSRRSRELFTRAKKAKLRQGQAKVSHCHSSAPHLPACAPPESCVQVLASVRTARDTAVATPPHGPSRPVLPTLVTLIVPRRRGVPCLVTAWR